jgi:hypothetical protein
MPFLLLLFLHLLAFERVDPELVAFLRRLGFRPSTRRPDAMLLLVSLYLAAGV